MKKFCIFVELSKSSCSNHAVHCICLNYFLNSFTAKLRTPIFGLRNNNSSSLPTSSRINSCFNIFYSCCWTGRRCQSFHSKALLQTSHCVRDLNRLFLKGTQTDIKNKTMRFSITTTHSFSIVQATLWTWPFTLGHHHLLHDVTYIYMNCFTCWSQRMQALWRTLPIKFSVIIKCSSGHLQRTRAIYFRIPIQHESSWRIADRCKDGGYKIKDCGRTEINAKVWMLFSSPEIISHLKEVFLPGQKQQKQQTFHQLFVQHLILSRVKRSADVAVNK